MNKKHYIALSLIAGLIALWIIFTKISIADILKTFENAPLWAVLGYVFSHIVIMFCLVLRWKVVIKSKEHKKISLWHLYWYKVIGYGVSFVTPTAKVGGEPVRAALLARHNIKFRKALSTVVIDKTIELTASGIFFIIGALVLLTMAPLPNTLRIIMTVVALVFIILIVYFYYQMLNGKDFFGKIYKKLRLHKSKRGKKIYKKLQTFEQLIIDFYHKDTKRFIQAITITFISLAITFIEYKSLMAILGFYDVNFFQLFLIISVVGVAYLIPIPMAIGSLEASQISLYAAIGLTSAAAVASSFLVRIKDLVWTICGFIALSIYGLSFSKTVKEANSLSKEVEKLK